MRKSAFALTAVASVWIFAACSGGPPDPQPTVSDSLTPTPTEPAAAVEPSAPPPEPTTPPASAAPAEDTSEPVSLDDSPADAAPSEAPDPPRERAPVPWQAPKEVILYAGAAVDWARRGTLAQGESITLVERTPPRRYVPTVWVRVEGEDVSGWVAAAELDVPEDVLDGLPLQPAEPIVAVALQDGIPLYQSPSTDQEAGHILALGATVEVNGRSPDALWLSGHAEVSCGQDCTTVRMGWVQVTPDSFDLDLPISDLPVLVGHFQVLAVAAGEVVDADIASSVVVAKTEPINERPARYSTGIQPWAWAGTSVLALLDGELLTRFDLVARTRNTVDGTTVSDFVTSPDGRYVLVVGSPDKTQELSLLEQSDVAMLSGTWTPNHPIPGRSLEDQGQWAPNGDRFLVLDGILNEFGNPSGIGWNLKVITLGEGEQIVGTGLAAAWTPDGEIVYVEEAQLKRVSADGVALPFTQAIRADRFAIAPTGDLIAVQVTSVTRVDTSDVVQVDSEITIYDSDGVLQANLGSGRLPHVRQPWAPDGSALLFHKSGDESHLLIWSVGENEASKLHDSAGQFEWAPQGQLLALTTREPRELLLIDFAGETTHIPGAGGYPLRWSPDGKTIITSATEVRADGLFIQSQIRAYSVDGHLLWAVGSATVCGLQAEWSADGKWVAIGGESRGCG